MDRDATFTAETPRARDAEPAIVSTRRLRDFTGVGYDKGRNKFWQATWFATQNLIFLKWWCPARLRPMILRVFGAYVGDRVFIRHRVRVLWPWKLSIGDDCWIGEDAWLLNLEPITIERDVCISQGAFLCGGSHKWRLPAFEYDNGAITVGAGAWVAARSIILRGTEIPADAVIPAGSVVAASAWDSPERAVNNVGNANYFSGKQESVQ
jgi:putative colanic acid biosynthesis acetyltransferase WcaF